MLTDKMDGYMNTYVKNVLTDHWDDYQLRSLVLGGNAEVFEVQKEYDIEFEESIQKKYSHPCMQWYRKKHIAEMGGLTFNTPKPRKNWKEGLDEAKSFATEKTQQMKQSYAQAMNEGVVQQSIGTKLKGMFSKKP